MATHSNILAWRILWTKEPSGLQSLGIPKSPKGLKRFSTHGSFSQRDRSSWQGGASLPTQHFFVCRGFVPVTPCCPGAEWVVQWLAGEERANRRLEEREVGSPGDFGGGQAGYAPECSPELPPPLEPVVPQRPTCSSPRSSQNKPQNCSLPTHLTQQQTLILENVQDMQNVIYIFLNSPNTSKLVNLRVSRESSHVESRGGFLLRFKFG